MQSVIFLLSLAVATGVQLQDKVTPVEKVVELLEKMKGEIAAEGKEEAASYDKFACFCKEQADDKLYAITKSEELIRKQTAQIKLLAGEIDELNAAVVELKEKKAGLEKEQKAAAAARAKEHEAYAVEEADMAGAIDAITRAIAALQDSKEQMKDAKLSLVQAGVPRAALEKILTAKSVTSAQLEAIAAFLEMSSSAAPGKPHAYEYRSNDIIATLQGLLKTFKADKAELDTTEASHRHDYDMEAQARGNTIKFMQEDIEEKEKISAQKEEEKSQTEADRTEETADMEADQAFMKELTAQGEEKAKDFDQRSTTRSAELTAISEAIGILKSGVQPNFSTNKKLTGLLASSSAHGHWTWVEDKAAPAKARAMSFLQVRSDASTSVPGRLLALLTRKAASLRSPILSTLAMKLQVVMGKDHFVKVRGIIRDLIEKLEADAESEASQKAFCDKEMGEQTTARDEAIGKVEEQTANIDEAESKIAKLTEEINDLSKEVAELRKGLFEATELRNKEKADNEQTIVEAEEGADAVKKAIEVLKKFYDNAFIQTGFVPAGADRDGNTVADLAPDTFSGEYNGKQDSAKGIFGLLEVIQSDFERTLETTKKAEEDAVAAFEEYKTETEADIDEKNKSKKKKESERESTEADLTNFRDLLKEARTALADAREELAKLKPLCVDTGASWEERRARQKQEVEALKEALAILEDWQK